MWSPDQLFLRFAVFFKIAGNSADTAAIILRFNPYHSTFLEKIEDRWFFARRAAGEVAYILEKERR